MADETRQTMKKLTKIRLVNWHYFVDETIDVADSVLFTGENASGKSTILDAIQLVLTTNTRRFNPAANERSTRDLKGYVRCKTGEEGNTYVRGTGPVISYVALEFFEEGRGRYFVLGVRLESPDPDTEIAKKWFIGEGRMDGFSFVVNGKPARGREFTNAGKPVQFETQVGLAKENIRNRLGHLEDRFFDMISKSMAFKPMDNVKAFINTYILPKQSIETENLRGAIRALQELQALVDDVERRIGALRKIDEEAERVTDTLRKAQIIDVLLRVCDLEDTLFRLQEEKHKAERAHLALRDIERKTVATEDRWKSTNEQLLELSSELATSEQGALITRLEAQRDAIGKDLVRARERLAALSVQVGKLRNAQAVADGIETAALETLSSATADLTDRQAAFVSVKQACADAAAQYDEARIELMAEARQLVDKRSELDARIARLKTNKLTYDKNTEDLRDAINREFAARGLRDARAEILADLLEISLPEWHDAVEGYLNTQRFNLIVEPRYYDIAASVYDRLRDRIHSVGLVNTAKLDVQAEAPEGSLAQAVQSNNRYARAYVTYVLGRVMRCETVEELKVHDIAITRTCMLYQGHVLRKINPQVYKTPYIGKRALEVQREQAQLERERVEVRIRKNDENQRSANAALGLVRACSFELLETVLDAPEEEAKLKRDLQVCETDLAEAKSDPTYMDLMFKRDQVQERLNKLSEEQRQLGVEKGRREEEINQARGHIASLNKDADVITADIHHLSGNSSSIEDEARKMFRENARTTGRAPSAIKDNYKKRKATLENQANDCRSRLITLQVSYQQGELGTGMEEMPAYHAELYKLEKAELTGYRDKIIEAQENCELEFRENFLAKLREKIQNAEADFNRLNRSLRDVFYGEDSYKFVLSANPEKQALHNMIMSPANVSGTSLFTQQFDENYHDEMEELFAKITASDLDGNRTLEEYTDYRSYLDYDIFINTRDGRTQKFSKTLGEKSGGETQTPYYVAIAASFAQLYSGGETARLLIFDEAFNNMDEDRTESMMAFLRSLGFQMIIAAPTARAEIIGPYVTTIHTIFRRGNSSWVESYELPA